MAVLTSLAYVRSRVRSPKTHQRVRLAVITNTAVADSYNKTHREGYYARACVCGGRLTFAWTGYGAPPLIHEVDVNPALTEPSFAWDELGRIHLLATSTGTEVVERISDDDGLTWNAAATHFSPGTHGEIAVGLDGLILRAAYVAGALKICRQDLGDAAPAAAFSALDAAATPLALQDDRFRLCCDDRNIWWLHARISGGQTTLLWSSDQGATWSVSDGAVTGLASGTHPGIAMAHNGTLLAWAYLAGNLQFSRRADGDTAWSAFAAAEDSMGSPLVLANFNFSLAPGVEEPDRWIGVWVPSGGSLPVEYASSDEAETWALL